MAIPSAEHFFEQAEKLLVSSSSGPPRQVDLRRAYSSAYYGIFHFCLTAAADEFVGSTRRGSNRYALVYRSIDHKTLKDLCSEAIKATPSTKYRPFIPAGGFGSDINAFATAVIELQERRILADYHPQERFTASGANQAISTARSAVRRLRAADAEQRKTFLTLLVCPAR